MALVPDCCLDGAQDLVDDVLARAERKPSKAEEYLAQAKKHVLDHLTEEDIQTLMNNSDYRAWAEKELKERESEKKVQHVEEWL